MHKKYLTISLLLLLTGPAFAQSVEDGIRLGQRSLATGARMTGLGVAGFAGIGDYSALYGNPAGLGLARQSEISGTLAMRRNRNEASSTSYGFALASSTHTMSSTGLSNLGWLYKAPATQGSLVFGLAYNRVADYDRELRYDGLNTAHTISSHFLPDWHEFSIAEDGSLAKLDDRVFGAFNAGLVEFFPELLEDNPEAYPFLEAVVPGTEISQSGRVTETGSLQEASFGGSIEVAPRTFVGASLNLAFGRYTYRSTFEEDDIYDQNDVLDYNVLLDNGTLLEGFDFLAYDQRLASDLLGLNLRIGVSTNIGSLFRVGTVLETPTRLGIDETYGISYETWFDRGGQLTYGNQSSDVGNGAFSYSLQTPWRLGIGISATFGKVTLLLDGQAADWSQMRFRGESGGYFEDLNDQIATDYSTAGSGGLGIEIDLQRWEVRAGFSFREEPLNVAIYNSDGSVKDREQEAFSLGFSYRFSPNMTIDVAWVTAEASDGYLPFPVGSYLPQDQLQIDEFLTRQQLAIGVSYVF